MITVQIGQHPKIKKSDLFKSAKVTSSASQIDDESNGFIDMVKSPTLLSKSSDYSGDSEDKQSKFSGSKDQGMFGLCSYKSTYMYIHIYIYRSLGALRAPTSSLRPFGPL